MKLRNLFFTALAATAFASCSNDDLADSVVNPGTEEGNAYISFAMQMPKSINARTITNGGTDAGTATPGESVVSTALALLFDSNSQVVTAEMLSWTNGTPSYADKASDAFEVDESAKKILVVVNPTPTIIDKGIKGATLATMKEALTISDVSELAANNQFVMSNYKLIDCAGFIVTGAVGETKEEVKARAKATPVVVAVDRLVSKVSLDLTGLATNPNPNATVTVEQWMLNVTNKKYYLMPDTCTSAEMDGSKYLYAKDPNFQNLASWTFTDYSKEFKTDNSFVANATSLYCAENTMQAVDQLYKYTTQAVLKVKFLPKKDIKGNEITGSWFRFEGKVYNATDLKAAVVGAAAGSSLKVAAAAFATAMSAADFDTAIGAVDEATSAKVKATGIEYFHNGSSYYQVMIRHNQFNDKLMTLGRYGTVRNNWYTLAVKSISEPGTSYLKDPETEIFTDNTEDDALTYISVQITVKPWTTWKQEVEL